MSALRALRPALRAVSVARIAAPRVVVPAYVAVARFHASARRMGSGETDSELSAALAAEQAYETEGAQDVKPEFVTDLENEGVWQLQDQPNHDDATLTRKFGDETLKLTFQISALDENAEPVQAVDEEGNVEDGVTPPFITSSLLITKAASPKAIMIDLGAGPEGFDITNVAIYDKALAQKEGVEADWDRRSRYMGPQFDTLDETVQDSFHDFLNERGVDQALANFVISYTEHKEQKDYITWLKQVKDFINA